MDRGTARPAEGPCSSAQSHRSSARRLPPPALRGPPAWEASRAGHHRTIVTSGPEATPRRPGSACRLAWGIDQVLEPVAPGSSAASTRARSPGSCSGVRPTCREVTARTLAEYARACRAGSGPHRATGQRRVDPHRDRDHHHGRRSGRHGRPAQLCAAAHVTGAGLLGRYEAWVRDLACADGRRDEVAESVWQ
jgi:hypothetical protein